MKLVNAFVMYCFPSSQVLLHLGIVTEEAGRHIAESAFSGGPLGELVQWSDLIAALHLLGHEMEFSTEVEHLIKSVGSKGGCIGGRVWVESAGGEGLGQSQRGRVCEIILGICNVHTHASHLNHAAINGFAR